MSESKTSIVPFVKRSCLRNGCLNVFRVRRTSEQWYCSDYCRYERATAASTRGPGTDQRRSRTWQLDDTEAARWERNLAALRGRLTAGDHPPEDAGAPTACISAVQRSVARFRRAKARLAEGRAPRRYRARARSLR